VLAILQRRRVANFLGALVCALLLAYAYYLQFYGGLEPCPLCIFQRVAVFAVAVVFLVAALHDPGPTGARIYGVLLLLVALAGMGVSARHLYIQSLPPGTVPSCGATLDFMLDMFPVYEVVRKVLTGSGECGVVDWRFLGLSMPAWVLISLVALALWAALVNFRSPRSQVSSSSSVR
jgi:disulfide bond formation protein DsbB